MGMDWLASCYATVYFQTKIVHFQFPKEVALEWKGNTIRGKLISYLKEDDFKRVHLPPGMNEKCTSRDTNSSIHYGCI